MAKKWQITRDGSTLKVRKNGETYSTVPYTPLNGVYRRLANDLKFPFEYWQVLAEYHRTEHDDKEVWESD